MGKHSQWRKLAKKLRRKRIRQSKAQERDYHIEQEQRELESTPEFKTWVREQEELDAQRTQMEEKVALDRHRQWLQDELEAQKRFQELQKKLQLAREERSRQNATIRLEWEKEQKRLQEIRERNERELEEKRKLQEKQNEEMAEFIEKGGTTPEHLKGTLETNPNKPPCPFFLKTSSCRFFDVCSRNHIRPKVSRIILIPNFYTHYSLEKPGKEHGVDSNLEFTEVETAADFEEFFQDVVPELEKCGPIRLVKVCCNHEAHLRGNLFVEYRTTRAALKSFQMFNGRWYGGKQLSVEFCNISSWKAAICGLFFRRRCPKGNTCNFLHVFKNPKNLYSNFETEKKSERLDSDRSGWRWSESPELDCYPRKGSRDWETPDRTHNESSKRREQKRSRSRDRSSRNKKKARSRSRRRSTSSSKRSKRRHSSRSSRRSSPLRSDA